MLPPHSDNLLDFASTFGEEGLTQTAGLPQRDEADGDLTEGGLGGKEEASFTAMVR